MFLIDYKYLVRFCGGLPRILREDNFFCAILHHKNGLIYQHKIDILHIPFRVVCKLLSLKIFNFLSHECQVSMYSRFLSISLLLFGM